LPAKNRLSDFKTNFLDTKFSPIYQDFAIYQILPDMTGLPQRLLAYDNSRFCFLKFTKPAHEHHLQVALAAQTSFPAVYRDFKKATET
jgi:hypothetical protein